MKLSVLIWRRDWPLSEPFEVSRGVQYQQSTLQIKLSDQNGFEGRGESCGVYYAEDSIDKMERQIKAILPVITGGITRTELLDILPAGGARHLIDSALWDLEAKRSGISAFQIAGLQPHPIQSAMTIGIRSLENYHSTALRLHDYPLLKVKVNAVNALEAIRAVRTGAPNARLIVDPNQSWSVCLLKSLMPSLVALGNIDLLEQPVRVGDESGLDGWYSPIPLCADELINSEEDLFRAKDRFKYINIKLEKAGGLTQALKLADAAEAQGFGLMVGCMGGSSLSMAPAMLLAQRCSFVDLDGPLLQSEDCLSGFTYNKGMVGATEIISLWG